MLRCQNIPKLEKLTARILFSIGALCSMMQMGFDFTPTGLAVVGQAIQQTLVVLLSRVKVSVNEWPVFTVTQRIECQRVFSAPPLNSMFLLIVGGPGRTVVRYDCRLKVVSQCNHKMDTAAWGTTN